MKTKRNLLQLCLLAGMLPAMQWLVLSAAGQSIVVTNTADSGPGTLRQAITTATNGTVISFAPSLSGATILLASKLTINTNLVIDGSALPNGIQINGNGSVQVFNVVSGPFLQVTVPATNAAAFFRLRQTN